MGKLSNKFFFLIFYWGWIGRLGLAYIHYYVQNSNQLKTLRDFLGSSVDKEFACRVGKPCSIPDLARSPGEENGNPLQYSCLENSMDRGAWWPIVHGVTKSQDMTE